MGVMKAPRKSAEENLEIDGDKLDAIIAGAMEKEANENPWDLYSK